MWCWRRTEIKRSEKVTNEEVLKRLGDKETFINSILRRKANWVSYVLRRNCLLHDAIERQMTELKGAGRRRTQFFDDFGDRRYSKLKERSSRKRTQLLDYLRNRRRYCGVKEEAEDKKRWKLHFVAWIRVYWRNKSYFSQIHGPFIK